MTREIQQIEGFENAEIVQVYPIREPDDDGCNWVLGSYPYKNSPATREFVDAVDKIVAEHKRKYNLPS